MTTPILVRAGAASLALVLAGAAAPCRAAPDPAAVAAALGLQEVTLQDVDVHPIGPQARLLAVVLGDRPVTIEAELVDLREPGARLLEQRDGGQLVEVPWPEPTTYRGRVLESPGSDVALSIVDGAIRGVIRLGEALPGQPMWYIQPVADAGEAGGKSGAHAVYAGDAALPGPWICGVVDGVMLAQDAEGKGDDGHDHDQNAPSAVTLGQAAAPPPAGAPTPRGPTPNCLRRGQIALDADFEYFTANGSSTPTTVNDMTGIINAANLIYARDVSVTFTITTSIVRAVSTDPYASADAGTLLQEFDEEWTTNQSSVSRDVAHLFTGRDLTGSTIGIARLSSVCSLTNGYGLSQSRFSTTFSRRTALTAHELGHNYSASHCDSAATDCAIMCSGLGGCSGNVTQFESVSANAIRNYAFGRACMEAAPGIATATAPKTRSITTSVAAGGTVIVDPLATATDANCQPLTISSFVTTTARGGTIVRGVGQGPGGRDVLRYTAAAGFVGSDTFSYTVTDGALSGAGTVTVNSLTLRPADTNIGPTQPGLDVAYYAIPSAAVIPDLNIRTPYLTTFVGSINFASTSGVFADSGRADSVAARYTGWFQAPADGAYTFYTTSDDGSRLFVGGTLVVDNDGVHGMQERSGTIGLRAGVHALRVDFFENTGGAGLIVEFAGGGQARQVISGARLVRPLPIPACSVADIVSIGGFAPPDGAISVDDYTSFVNAFASGAALADIVSIGGFPPEDGAVTVDDYTSFINAFADGCN